MGYGYRDPVKLACIALAFVAWYFLTTPGQKVLSCIAATVYSGIEFSWYATTVENRDGSLTFSPGNPKCRKGHTTFEQWWCNVLWTVVLLHHYANFVAWICPAWITPWALRLALFPLDVWLLEIVEGYFLIFIFGRNVAWEYAGADSFFHGNIKLSHARLWIVLGVFVELLRPTMLSILR